MTRGLRIMARCALWAFVIVMSTLQASSQQDVPRKDSDRSGHGGADSGASKIGGSHGNLPPCKIQGQQIIHENISCIYTPTSSDKQRHKDGGLHADSRGNMSSSESVHDIVGRGGAGDRKGRPEYKETPDPYDRDGKYWLVPPFLIGASSVIVVYIVIHCLYLHCYAKRKMRQMAHRSSAPAIIFSDGDGPSLSSLQTYTPIVTYDGSSYGHTDVGRADSQPFIVYQPVDSPDRPPDVSTERRPSTRRKSMHLQLPNLFRNRGRPTRPSVCSASAAMETSTSSIGEPSAEAKQNMRRATRASICYVPVSRTISDPTGGAGNQQPFEWTPLQGFVYPPPVMLPSNASFSVPSGSFSSTSRDDIPTSPFILIPNPDYVADPPQPETSGAAQRRDSDMSRTPSMRKTSFKDPESQTVTIPLTVHPEEEREEK